MIKHPPGSAQEAPNAGQEAQELRKGLVGGHGRGRGSAPGQRAESGGGQDIFI